MPVEMYTSFRVDPRLPVGVSLFYGAEVALSYSLAENEIEFQNVHEPVDERFNGRFELGENLSTIHGVPKDWKRVEESDSNLDPAA